jgi:hypothetical protein
MGGKTTIQQPAPPPAPTLGGTIAEYVEAQPSLFALQQQQAPMEAQQQLELLQQFGAPMGQAFQEAQRALQPTTTGLQEELAGIAQGGFAPLSGELSPEEVAQFRSDFRGALGRGAGSPIAAEAESRQLEISRQQREREATLQNLNLGLTLSGRQQLAQPQMPGFTSQVGGLTPAGALGFQQGIFGTQANIFGTQAQAATARRGQNLGFWGDIIGGGLGGFSAMI